LSRSNQHRCCHRNGLLPIVGIARYASLAAGVRLTSSRERLDFASTAAVLDGGDARVLEETFQLFCRMRPDHQVEQLRAGLEPDDYIDAEDLNPVTRSYGREAFHAASLVQRSLEGELALPPP
jgi:CBS domain-containing protein